MNALPDNPSLASPVRRPIASGSMVFALVMAMACTGAYCASVWQEAEKEFQDIYQVREPYYAVRKIPSARGTISRVRTFNDMAGCIRTVAIVADVVLEEPTELRGRTASFWVAWTDENEWLRQAVGSRIAVAPKLDARPYLELRAPRKDPARMSVEVYSFGTVRTDIQ